MMGSWGCIVSCWRLGRFFGYCELPDPRLGWYPGCGTRDCCCFCF
jgi:hypothetical protein